MDQLGKWLFVGGLGLAALGALIWLLPDGFKPFRLPGDIAIEKPGMSFYFPITTMILFSLAMIGVNWAIQFFRK